MKTSKLTFSPRERPEDKASVPEPENNCRIHWWQWSRVKFVLRKVRICNNTSLVSIIRAIFIDFLAHYSHKEGLRKNIVVFLWLSGILIPGCQMAVGLEILYSF